MSDTIKSNKKTMTPERKAKLIEQLARGRETSRKNREEKGKKLINKPKKLINHKEKVINNINLQEGKLKDNHIVIPETEPKNDNSNNIEESKDNNTEVSKTIIETPKQLRMSGIKFNPWMKY